MQKLFEHVPRPLTLEQELILATNSLIKVLPDSEYVGPSPAADPNEHGDARYSKEEYEGYGSAKYVFELGVDESGPYALIELPESPDNTVRKAKSFVVELGVNGAESQRAQVEDREYHSIEVADQFDVRLKELMDGTAGLSPQYIQELQGSLKSARQSWDRNREPEIYEPRDMTMAEKLGLLARINTMHGEYLASADE